MGATVKNTLAEEVYTLEEYLAFEEQAETKHKYHQGHIVAMTGASINHNRIALDVGGSTDKFRTYWSLVTLQEYVLIDQHRVLVEYFRRVDERKWELLIFNQLADHLPLKSINVTLPLSEIYRKVDLG